jgi:branched-chain amino acid transport system ATP-binding protein
MRSVFLEGAATLATPASTTPATPPAPPTGAPTTGTSQPALQVNDVSKSFGGIRAIDDVSFSVGTGEVVGVLGPNGAGKTTLFDVIGGFELADAGSVLLTDADGTVHDLSSSPPAVRAMRGLGRSFQDARLFPALTVHETIEVSLERFVPVRDPIAAALHLPAVLDSEEVVAHRADELIAMLGLEAFRDKFVRELSTGTRRVVDLACVVAHGPRVLLLDEPSSGIAQREAEALGPLLLRIREELGTSLVVIEHDLPLLRAVADRLIALDLGVVIADGPPAVVVADPRVVAAYLGEDAAAVARSGTRA